MLVFPQGIDQVGGAYRVEKMGCGINLGKYPTKDMILSGIKFLQQKDNKISKAVSRMQKLVEFKELR